VTQPADPAEVVREHVTLVWRVLRHLGVSETQLEDASQEVFLIVLRQLPKFEARSSLRTWIYGICRNVAHRARVERMQLRELPVAELPESSEPAKQDRELWLKQAHAQLIVALDALDEDQRAVFVLYEIEELPMEEIAAALGSPLTTCYSRLQTASSKVEAALRRTEQRGAFKVLKGGAR
jgi:RNA polymerase sigma-70 factor (ECF subfamily)